jgi:hypothetical protein
MQSKKLTTRHWEELKRVEEMIGRRPNTGRLIVHIRHPGSIDLKLPFRTIRGLEIRMFLKIPRRKLLKDQSNGKKLRQGRGVRYTRYMELTLMDKPTPPFKNQSLLEQKSPNPTLFKPMSLQYKR